MTLEKLQVIIEAQTSQYMDAMKKVQNSTNSTVSKVNNYVGKIKNVIGTVGKVVGAAFSVISIISFGRACVALGSDLAEVQNVVDVTFGEGNKKIEDWAKGAADAFGLSELSAKQYTSTMGAMLKSMGIAGDELEDMSTKLAGLAGDMASFYNLDSDTAFAKIRSGISGETEPLKQLGINLSAANLQAFALSQGITKSYSAMTQQEQALLRYNYLLNVTADAQGDFARTSDSWANQTRILQLRFESIKATIGQGLINVLTPVIKVINMLVAKLQVAADAFKRFTEIITGKKSESASSSVGGIAADLSSAESNADALTGATTAAGKAAKKAEEAYHGLGKFDELNSLSKAADDTDTSGAGGGAGAGGAGDLAGAISDSAEEANAQLHPALQMLIDKLKELKELFTNGFKSGFGDISFNPLLNSISSIQKSVMGIWMDPEVLSAANTCMDRWTYSLGQTVGAVASVGTTIATNLVGGVSKYLEQNAPRVQEYTLAMFDISGDMAEIGGNTAQAAANIFSVFGGENGQQVTANLIGIFADAFMGISELTGKFTVDTSDALTKPFIDNQGEFKTALDGILETVSTITGSIKDVVDGFVDDVNKVYDEHFAPLFKSIGEGLSDSTGKFLEFWNSKVKPFLDKIGKDFKKLSDEHVSPMLKKVVEFFGAVGDAISVFWTNILKPAIDWIIANVLPVLLPILQAVWNTVKRIFGFICDMIGGVFRTLKGLINFIIGVFTGDWEKAWGGIKDIFGGIWDTIYAFLGTIWASILGLFETTLATLKATFSIAWSAIKDIVLGIWDKIKTGISNAINYVSTCISVTLNVIKAVFSAIWNAISTAVSTVWNAIKLTISTTINTISSIISTVLGTIKDTFTNIWNNISTGISTVWGNIKSTISTKIDEVSTKVSTVLGTIKDTFTNIWSGITTTVSTAIGNVKKTLSDTLTKISEKWSEIWEGMETAVTDVFTNMWNAIKGTINSIIGGVESMANGIINGINAAINALNNLSFTVPDWVPEIGGKTIGFNIPTLSGISIPRLAKGGIVDGATPLIAGEAGKEAIVPLENNTGWIEKIASRLGEIISVNIQGILSDMEGSNEYQTINTVVKLDSKTLVEQTDKFRRRKGYQMADA